jgi:CDGSH-type Zn-finger protein
VRRLPGAGVVIMTQRPGRLAPLSDAPYGVTRAMETVDADGQVIQPPADTFLLCRGGHSASKACCDGPHARRGWTAENQ